MTSSKAIPIVVLASGRGSNFDAILKSIRDGKLHAEMKALISDQPDALALKRAEEAGIPAVCVPVSQDPKTKILPVAERRKIHDQEMLRAIAPFHPRFLVMAGYMRVVSSTLIEAFRSERGYSRITNVHPSLLPAFPGVNSYGQAFRYGAALAGVTVHLVEEDVDQGPICAQESFEIRSCRGPEEVERLGLAIEHRLYPESLNWILPERFEAVQRERRLCVCPH